MKFIAFDLETTGFLPGVDQITEIGAVRYNNGAPEGVFSTLINPGRPIPPEVTRITGITDEMVSHKPPIDSVLSALSEFCEDALLVAHNAPFDFQFLNADFKKFEVGAPRGAILDTCAMARKVFPGLLNYKLGTLVQHLKIESAGFHRAEEDASYCGQLFIHILNKISISGQPPSLESLIAISGGAPLRFPEIVRQPKQLDLLSSLGI